MRSPILIGLGDRSKIGFVTTPTDRPTEGSISSTEWSSAQHHQKNYRKEEHMTMKDKVVNRLQDLRGKGKQEIGSFLGNKHLETEGKVEQTKAGLKDAGENVKTAATKAKDAVKPH
jgi:uncharacterized protein YjbJ (UPF0337 family)